MSKRWTQELGRPGGLDEPIARALAKVGITLEGQAKALAPVRLVGGGRLRGSITYATQKQRSRPSGDNSRQGDAVSAPNNKYTLHVGTNVEYAPYVEYGTRFMRSQSYLRRALSEYRAEIPKIFRDEIRRACGQ